MSREILEATIRAYVAKGSGLDGGAVIPGQEPEHPPEGLFASVYLMSEYPIGRNTGYQYIGSLESFVVEDVVVKSVYSIQWYRKGALDAANRFFVWARSQSGVNWADSAITDGRIRRANVYGGGEGYEEGDIISFPHLEGEPGDSGTRVVATGTLGVDNRGRAAWVYMTNFGEGYWDIPTATIEGEGINAEIAPMGFGFTVQDPFMVRNLTQPFADDFEERAGIDLHICHARNYIDRDSGRVETINYSPEATGFA